MQKLTLTLAAAALLLSASAFAGDYDFLLRLRRGGVYVPPDTTACALEAWTNVPRGMLALAYKPAPGRICPRRNVEFYLCTSGINDCPRCKASNGALCEEFDDEFMLQVCDAGGFEINGIRYGLGTFTPGRDDAPCLSPTFAKHAP